MLKKILLATVLTALLFALTGCQTFQGFGKDVEWVGEKISGSGE